MQSISIPTILEVMISLALIYFLLSTIVSLLVETITFYTKKRSLFLEESIHKLLEDRSNKNFGYLLYVHPLVNAMKPSKNKGPQYIPDETFATALIDIIGNHEFLPEFEKQDGKVTLVKKERTEDPVQRFKNGLTNLNESELKDLLTLFHANAIAKFPENSKDQTSELNRLKAELMSWYKNYMDRMKGVYKNKMVKPTRWMALLVVLVLNVDSIHIAQSLFRDDDMRQALVREAEEISDKYEKLADTTEEARLRSILRTFDNSIVMVQNATNKSQVIDSVKLEQTRLDSTAIALMLKFNLKLDSIQRLKLRHADSVYSILTANRVPLGWNQENAPLSWKRDKGECCLDKKIMPLDYFEKRNQWSGMNLLIYITGLFISVVSLSFGAPFWFDVMNKLINIRRSGVIPKSKDDSN